MRPGPWQIEVLQNPIIKRTVHFKFQRAKGMGHSFDIIAQAVCEIIHRVNTPPVASAVMRTMPNPVEHGVPHPNVRRLHVNLCPKRAKTVGKLARAHPLEEVQNFLRRASAKWTLLSVYTVPVSVRGREVVHISL